MSYVGPLLSIVEHSDNFREVVFNGEKTQLVVMTLLSGEDIGEEVHDHVEQTLYIQQGAGQAVLDGKVWDIKAGDVVVVTPGTRHNVINGDGGLMRLFTVYVPANHIRTTVHKTKADAMADEADEQYGEAAH